MAGGLESEMEEVDEEVERSLEEKLVERRSRMLPSALERRPEGRRGQAEVEELAVAFEASEPAEGLRRGRPSVRAAVAKAGGLSSAGRTSSKKGRSDRCWRL